MPCCDSRCQALRDPAPGSPLSSSWIQPPHFLSLSLTLAFFLFLARGAFAFCCFPQPGMLFPRTFMWLVPSHPFSSCSISSKRPSNFIDTLHNRNEQIATFSLMCAHNSAAGFCPPRSACETSVHGRFLVCGIAPLSPFLPHLCPGIIPTPVAETQ